MNTKNNRQVPWLWIGTIGFGVLFGLLLLMRVDFFSRPQTLPAAAVADRTEAEESWLGIYQGDDKIGYSHRSWIPEAKGYRMADETFMRLNTMGMVQEVDLRTRARLAADRSLQEFDFDLRSSTFRFSANGKIADGKLHLTMNARETVIPLKAPIYLAAGVLDAVRNNVMIPNRPQTFSIFDPATMAQRPVTVTYTGRETIELEGERVEARKMLIDFMGANQMAWIDDEGRVLREEGLMGIRLERTTREAALTGLASAPGTDLTEVAAVTVDVPLEDRARLSRLALRIDGLGTSHALDGDRQTYREGVLTITREAVPNPQSIDTRGLETHLASSPLVQADHPAIRRLSDELVRPADPPAVKVRKIVGWMYANIEKRPVMSVPNALEVLENRVGDCNEHAVLLAALLRAAGIPTQIEAGLVYLRGKFFYHAWNSVFLGRWITVDALMNQIPADVTHIRLVRGAPQHQVDLMGVIGRLRLSVVDKE